MSEAGRVRQWLAAMVRNLISGYQVAGQRMVSWDWTERRRDAAGGGDVRDQAGDEQVSVTSRRVAVVK